MTQHLEHARKAMTAIAAVLALSSTPLLAQEAASPAPVGDPAPTSEPPAADPLAAEPAPAPTTTETAAAPAKPKAATTAKRTTTTTRTTTRTATRSAPAAPAAEPAAPAPAEALAAVPVAPGPMPVAEPEAIPADEPQSGFAELDPDAALPLAGAGALGLILLGGAAAVRRRKRRKQEEADEAAKWAFIQSHAEEDRPQQVDDRPAFAWAASPRHDPVPGKTPVAGAPTTRLPEGFDLSRFGPHVQAAYRGPTTDNPSLSLRHRLRRASFLDQQERRATETASAKPRDVPAKGNWESRPDADFMFRRSAKPALQH